MHPWDDPRNAPANYDHALGAPHGAVDPSRFASFHEYQNALNAQHAQDQYEGWSAAESLRQEEDFMLLMTALL
ncbi:hypothetical protein [Actinomycetospora aeridis]|uniref:Uncharacterized protein n=1 Tax=Actinomycetospora aeridis TaxID=3129231 RepID=A0ABU8NAS2_9PSEU